jgi:hypothetical protein
MIYDQVVFFASLKAAKDDPGARSTGARNLGESTIFR